MKVAVLMGSDSDWEVMREAVTTLKEFGVPFEVEVISAHRTPRRAAEFASKAKGRGFEVIIAGAGRAAHLAGFMAAHTTLPVIGVPIGGGALGGVDALYSTVQMPPGVPVATVSINGARNAALLAVEILALKHEELSRKLDLHREEMARKVAQRSDRIRSKLSEEGLSGG
ncbi:TPA: 5-(carboxyamino)imidazole ribonucleotide mutase [Candidatus Poribacteria bacterium]|nr:5-(carboxyamino)imidazole ribonucleotide mutase [Candidatus Poribacteria bacterium]